MSDWEEFFLAASPALLAPRARFRHNCSLRRGGGGGGWRRRLLEFRQLVLERGSEKTAVGEKKKEQVKCFLEEVKWREGKITEFSYKKHCLSR